MLLKCKYCLPAEGIEVPGFTALEKSAIVKQARLSPIHTVKYLMDHFKLSHSEAKFIMSHINTIDGKCNRCDFEALEKENTACPKCGALNLNWKISPGT